jgi:hypothetical protein
MKRTNLWFYTVAPALLAAALLLAGCGELDLAVGPLLHTVSFSGDQITPNADPLQPAPPGQCQHLLYRC